LWGDVASTKISLDGTSPVSMDVTFCGRLRCFDASTGQRLGVKPHE
jgi:hypothetical protein